MWQTHLSDLPYLLEISVTLNRPFSYPVIHLDSLPAPGAAWPKSSHVALEDMHTLQVTCVALTS